jgi:hypothetical protein
MLLEIYACGEMLSSEKIVTSSGMSGEAGRIARELSACYKF